MTRWYVYRNGQTEGPYEEDVVGQWIRGGHFAQGHVCPEGAQQWMGLSDHLPFARALRDAATGPTVSPGQVMAGAGASGTDPTQHSLGAEAAIAASYVSGAAAAPGGTSAVAMAAAAAPVKVDLSSVRPAAAASSPVVPRRLDRTQKLDEPESDAVSSTWDGIPGGPSNIPPSSVPDREKFVTPLGSRTPARPLQAPDFGGQLPASAPDWMHRAQRMVAGLQQALQQMNIDESTLACIDRAWAGWELDGSNERQIARVALLAEKAHEAVRAAPPERADKTIQDCAELLRNGLPRHVRKGVATSDVALVVRRMRGEADPWIASVDATCALLGWSDAARAHGARAIRIAIKNIRAAKSP